MSKVAFDTTQISVDFIRNVVKDLRHNLSSVIRGKDETIELTLVALLGEGNILLEDVPGVGKTTLAKCLAKSIDGKFNRIQFTPDLLPADIIGGSIYNPQTGEFNFRPGPIFSNILVADEINRASPRTQSALLESMTERQITIEGQCHLLIPPFIVVATQNPIEFHGTYPLPESQLDRFMIRLEIGYPTEIDELAILNNQRLSHPIDDLSAVTDGDAVVNTQRYIRTIGMEESVAKYILALVRTTRDDSRLRLGASPRASLMLYRAAQSLAFIRQRDFVVPDDVKDLAVSVLSHRIILDSKTRYTGAEKDSVIRDLVNSVPVPI